MSDFTLDLELHKDNYKYANFGHRIAASLVDMLIFLPLIIASLYNIYYTKNLGFAILVILVSYFYKPLMEYYYGATLGKMALKMKVLDLHFEEISMGQAFTRTIPWILTSLVNIYVTVLMFDDSDFYDAEGLWDFSMYAQTFEPNSYNSYAMIIFVITIIFMFWEKRKQMLHDKAAKTVVIKLD